MFEIETHGAIPYARRGIENTAHDCGLHYPHRKCTKKLIIILARLLDKILIYKVQ